jgi:hypothetical protein
MCRAAILAHAKGRQARRLRSRAPRPLGSPEQSGPARAPVPSKRQPPGSHDRPFAGRSRGCSALRWSRSSRWPGHPRGRRGRGRERRAHRAARAARCSRVCPRRLARVRATTSARAKGRASSSEPVRRGAAGRSAAREATSTSAPETPRGSVASVGSSGSEVGAAAEPALGAETATAGVATSGLPPAGKLADASGNEPCSRETSARTPPAEPGAAGGRLSSAAGAGSSADPGSAAALRRRCAPLDARPSRGALRRERLPRQPESDPRSHVPRAARCRLPARTRRQYAPGSPWTAPEHGRSRLRSAAGLRCSLRASESKAFRPRPATAGGSRPGRSARDRSLLSARPLPTVLPPTHGRGPLRRARRAHPAAARACPAGISPRAASKARPGVTAFRAAVRRGRIRTALLSRPPRARRDAGCRVLMFRPRRQDAPGRWGRPRPWNG